MLKINLKQLEAFVATAEYSSFTKAAEELFLTQSTVSSHIRALETALGIRLIQRGARQRVTLTAEGERVYRESREILDRCQSLQEMKEQDRERQLVIGASSVPGQCLMPEIMGDYLRQHPDCRYVQLRGDSIRIHQYLAQGKANLGFVGVAANPREYRYHSVAEDRLVLITANTEPFRAMQRDKEPVAAEDAHDPPGGKLRHPAGDGAVPAGSGPGPGEAECHRPDRQPRGHPFQCQPGTGSIHHVGAGGPGISAVRAAAVL